MLLLELVNQYKFERKPNVYRCLIQIWLW